MGALTHGFGTPTRGFVRGWAWASLVANIVIVLTGGAVRLTASGLGCPTWPRCTDQSFVPHRALGMHGIIEFGNRMLTYVLIAIAVATWVAVMRWTNKGDRRRRVATVMALGIPLQGVLGGVTVLTDLNPWIVALHLMLSMGLIAAAMLLLHRVGEVRTEPVPPVALWLVRGTYAVAWIALYAGTVVTGSGPHAGDLDSRRNGLDPQVMSHVHAACVYVLVALTIGCVIALRGAASRQVRRAAWWLLGVELAQGALGFVQYVTDLPIVLVWFHLLGASVLMAVATRLALAASPRAAAAASASPDGSLDLSTR